MADATNSAAAADELDQLLDSALDDFTNLNLGLSTAASSSSSGSGGADPKPAKVQGLGMGLPDPKARRPAKPRPAADPAARGSSAAEAFERLTRETHEAVRGIASATSAPAGAGGPLLGFGDGEWDENAMVEEFMKHFGTADDLMKHFGDAVGSDSEEGIMESMMHMLLSKDLLYEPMKEIAGKYPKWLDEHKGTLSKEEFEQHSHQYELIAKLNGVYENDPENLPKVMEILQEMQKCSLPPEEIVREIVPDFDLSTLGQLQPGQAPNCSIM